VRYVKLGLLKNKMLLLDIGLWYNKTRMKFDKEKFKNAVLYLAKYGGKKVGKKKLAKLLYFVDFTLYELREKPLTGITYTKMYYGLMPEPNTFYSKLNELQAKGIIDIKHEIKIAYCEHLIIPKKDPEIDIFDDQEKEWLKKIAEQYYSKDAGELEKIMKSEPPYQMTEKDGELTPYHLAFYRNTFGEMNLENNANSHTFGVTR